jgi:hypothetical protein
MGFRRPSTNTFSLNEECKWIITLTAWNYWPKDDLALSISHFASKGVDLPPATDWGSVATLEFEKITAAAGTSIYVNRQKDKSDLRFKVFGDGCFAEE